MFIWLEISAKCSYALMFWRQCAFSLAFQKDVYLCLKMRNTGKYPQKHFEIIYGSGVKINNVPTSWEYSLASATLFSLLCVGFIVPWTFWAAEKKNPIKSCRSICYILKGTATSHTALKWTGLLQNIDIKINFNESRHLQNLVLLSNS